MAKLGYWLIRGPMRALGTLPLGFHLACGKALGWLAGSVLRYRRDVVTANLARSFPDKKYAELAKIRKDFYRYLGTVFAESVWFCGCDGEKGGRRLQKEDIVRFTNPETLVSLYEQSDSIVLLTAHSGNWELTGGFMFYSPDLPLPFAENDVHVIYKRLTSDAWDAVMRRNRISPIVDKTAYDGLVESRDALRHVLSRRGQKKLYAFITDQHPYQGSAAIDVGEFMHQPTTSMDGAAKLAVKLGLAVAYMSFQPAEKEGRWTITFEPICTDASGADSGDIMKKYYQLLQRDLEAVPWNYLWTHKRWK
ncbi:MAG: lysophospholipid acyltransferase family protein [Bacteroidales bacterium]|nr:lysophospholipid acyltransferase family protein [Bacteroidales bacterium]